MANTEWTQRAGMNSVSDTVTVATYVDQAEAARDAAQGFEVGAEAAADRAEVAAASVSLEVADYAALDALTGGVNVGETVRRRDIDQLYVRVASGGFVNSNGLRFSPVSASAYSLSDYGVNDGDIADDALANMFGRAATGDHIVIDRDVTFTGTIGWSLDYLSDLTIEWVGSGKITAPNIAGDDYLLRIRGEQQPDLTVDTAHNIEAGEWYLVVTDASAVQVGDLINVQTNIFFNGTGDSGFDVVIKEDWLRVRSVSGNSVLFTNPFWFNANGTTEVTAVKHWRPANNVRIVNPRVEGPANGIANGTTNGSGQKAFLIYGVTDFEAVGDMGNVSGWSGYCFQISRYDNAIVDGMVFDSLETSKTTQAYYGVVHEAGRNGQVRNCLGRNIRRTADTGTSGLAIDTFHQNIQGELVNGSTAGTHHGYRYSFDNIRARSGSNGMTIRSKENTGYGVSMQGVGGVGISIGHGATSDDPDVGCGHTQIHGIWSEGGEDSTATRSNTVRCQANGSYDLQGEMRDHTTNGVHVDARHVTGIKIRGDLGGNGANYNVLIAGQLALEGVDIVGCVMDGATLGDVRIGGTELPSNPARHIRVDKNTLKSLVEFQVIMNRASDGDAGYIEGESTSIADNIGTLGTGTNPVLIGSPELWTCAPVVQRNRKEARGGVYDSFSYGNKQSLCVGTYADTAALPSATTYLEGAFFRVSDPAAGDYPEYECIFSGTTGTLTGVTGDISSGSDQLTLTGNIGQLGVGQIITVAGSGVSVYRIKALSDDLATATLSSAATITVSGAAVAYRNPAFYGRGILST